MSYFEDQYDAWMDSGCQGDPTDMNPDEYYADKIFACEAGGHGKIIKRGEYKVCEGCDLIFPKEPNTNKS